MLDFSSASYLVAPRQVLATANIVLLRWSLVRLLATWMMLGLGVGCTDPARRTGPPPEGTGQTTSAEAGLSFTAPPSTPGRLFLADGELRLIPCGDEGDGIRLDDRPDGEGEALVRMLDFGDRGIAVMIRIEGARLQEIRYGGPEEPDCDRLPPAGEVEARGNEPFWSINIDGAVARVRTPEELDGVHYGDGSWSRTEEERWRHRSQRQGPHGLETLILELMAERCTDTMSGAWFPFKAVLVRDDRRMEGCAVEGGRAGRTPPQ